MNQFDYTNCANVDHSFEFEKQYGKWVLVCSVCGIVKVLNQNRFKKVDSIEEIFNDDEMADI